MTDISRYLRFLQDAGWLDGSGRQPMEGTNALDLNLL